MSKTGTCKHFNGAYHNIACDLGICYRDVTTEPDRQEGSALRIPCHTADSAARQDLQPQQLVEFNKRGKCEFYEEQTAEEIAAEEAAIQSHIARFMKSGPLISRVKKEHKGQDWQGVETCPVCAGKLHMSHAACNGHVWGRCETEDCLSWME